MSNDRSWVRLYKGDPAFRVGALEFIKFARENSSSNNGLYPCPCIKCKNMGEHLDEEDIYMHLMCNGMKPTYTVWDKHGETIGPNSQHWYTLERRGRGTSLNYEYGQSSSQVGDPVVELLNDAFPFREPHGSNVPQYVEQEAMASYQRLIGETSIPLYEGSTVSSLQAMLESLQLKDSTDMSDAAYNKMATFVKRILPKDNRFPNSYNEVKKDMKKLGMGFEVIHACVNGCMLFYKEYSDDEDCRICHASRWTDYISPKGRRKPARTVRYFPLTPRLQRLYTCKSTAEEMRWHGSRTVDNDYLRHPSDGESWKEFDRYFS